MRHSLLAAIVSLAAALSPARAEPGLDHGRFLLDTGFVSSLAFPNQNSSVAAFNGTCILAVWVDRRGGESDIYGCRVTPDGVLLDSAGIPISTTPRTQWYPAVCSDGTGFLVAWWWWDESGGASRIYASPVTSAGTVLDTAGIRVSPDASGQSMPAIAFDGANYLVAWEDTSGTGDIYCARVTPAGNVLDTAGIPVCVRSGHQAFPDVAFNGTDFVVVWSDERMLSYDIYASRVTSSGIVLDPNGIRVSNSISDDEHSPSVGSNGTVSLVAWSQAPPTGRNRLYFARVSQDGTVLDTAGVRLGTTRVDNLTDPAVAFDGENFVAAWDEDRGMPIWAARVTPGGVVLDSTSILIPVTALVNYEPEVCPNGNGSVVLWHQYDTVNTDWASIYAARVTRAGTVLDSTAVNLALAAHAQQYPALAFDGTNYLAVWEDWRGGDPDIYACRVAPGGTVLDPGGIPVCTMDYYSQLAPAVAFDGASFLVVWEDWRHSDTGSMMADVYGARVTPTGTVLDPGGIPIRVARGTQGVPRVGYNGTDFLVVWQRGLADADIHCSRVTSAGVVRDSFIDVCTRYGETYTPEVAFDGANALVVWQDDRGGQYADDIYCARVTPTGVSLDTLGLPVSTAPRGQFTPAIAFDGANYLVAWHDTRHGTGRYDIFCARMTPGGIQLDSSGIPVCTTAATQTNARVTFDGADYLVTWVDDRNGSRDIYGARISPAGVVGDAALVVGGDGAQYTAALCRGSGNQVLLAFGDLARTVGGRTYNAQRIWGRFGFFPAMQDEHPVALSRPPLPGPTIVRGVLDLQSSTCNLKSEIALLDAAGRKVLDLRPGPNDVSRLATGVYFVRSAIDVRHSSITKVVMTR
ncbi:hypothetical protein FJY68_06175 [candidate division WOR-3 bacterium]|uniref:T9SS type A sorting domain-containing protein n=1 Tax=candidate division WOR-3 bacterium TaxID=2052148 RepID=A0A937XG54_UNCW3|nr:hypothetical protein [candidate division WOR-3 bacterium]